MPTSLKQTPLNQAHRDAHAHMINFGDWNMPLAYGSQREEHLFVRQDAGMFDVSHMLNVEVRGIAARAFLRRLLANDVAKLRTPGSALYSCMLNPEGGILDDLIVYALTDTHFRVVVNATPAHRDVAWMRRVATTENFAVEVIAREDLAILAVQGPMACVKLWQARPHWQALGETLKPFSAAWVENDADADADTKTDVDADAKTDADAKIDTKNKTLLARTGYTGEDGFEIMLPATHVMDLWQALRAQGVHPCGLGARDTLRIEAGLNLYGQDMDESTLPMEVGLAWSVSFKDHDRDFIGRAALEQSHASNVFLGLKLTEPGIMRTKMVVRTPHGEGVITSGTVSPILNFSIALARLPQPVHPGDRVQVNMRGTWRDATVCKLPFVRHGKVMDHAA